MITLLLASLLASQDPDPIRCEILVVGGSFGGVAAALGSAGKDVHVVEDSDWIGGQVSSQGVSALDEHQYIETFGGTRSYYRFRDAVRARYAGKKNPGGGWVSRLCFEPKVGLAVLEEMVGKTKIHRECKLVSARVEQDAIVGVTFRRKDGQLLRFAPSYVLDATDTGDLLPLVGAEFRTGAEARAETGESLAEEKADPNRLQSFTFPFAVEFRKGERHVIAKPEGYEAFRKSQPYTLSPKNREGQANAFGFFAHRPGSAGPFWTYRRLTPEIAMINWPGNDYRGTSILAPDLDEAKRLSLGFLYRLQTECPRDEGGKGYPELLLRKDVMGTEDGLSKRPYVREGRRLVARTRIVEQDLTPPKGARARPFADSVGVGLYSIDVHSCFGDPDETRHRYVKTKPFQIPLGALVPVRLVNLLAAGKCLGTTHVTNGAYRLHPIEWNIGESAGQVASFCIDQGQTPAVVLAESKLQHALQVRLLESGIPIFWFVDLPLGNAAFVAAQALAVRGQIELDAETLLFDPKPERVADAQRRFLRK